ncbi:MAG: T9SS type A sorting domain-containing protein [Bacteroidales bacterium]
MLRFVVILFVGFVSDVFSQDTLKLMHYNMLFYGKDTDFCSQNIETKTEHLKTIFQYIKPDVFAVNELDGENSYPVQDDEEYLLDNALNTDGIDYYKAAPFNETYLANTLFYNSDKLVLDSHKPIRFHVGKYEKIFNAYTFYYRSDDLAEGSDTAFFTCFGVHLKSGRDDSDIKEREEETMILMDFIKNNFDDDWNYFVFGDLNVYKAEEAAFQNLINGDNFYYNLYDPADAIGHWHDNGEFAEYHTQSTHTSGDCFAGGGMDDRFDFILASSSVMGGTHSIEYVEDSYKVLGQDGKCFNAALDRTNNNSVPDSIAQALYDFSDHLPVTLEAEIEKNLADTKEVDSVNYYPETAGVTDSVVVNASILDTQNRVEEVELQWGYANGDYESSGSMRFSDGFYEAIIPPVDSHEKVYFKINGFDKYSNIILESEEYAYEVALNTGFVARRQKNEAPFCINNPVKDQLTIWFDEHFDNFTIQVGTIEGQKLINETYEHNPENPLKISLSDMEPGLYWLKMQIPDNSIYGKKLILLNR